MRKAKYSLNQLAIQLAGRVMLITLLALSACVSGPRLVAHGFSYNGWSDKWATENDLLAYSYGEQYSMVRDQGNPDQSGIGYQSGVNGDMPVGKFLSVRWRIKSTGEVIEDRVDLRSILPNDMFGHRITFVIDGRQLFVYLVTPKTKPIEVQPPLKTTLSRYYVTYEIYPNNSFKL